MNSSGFTGATRSAGLLLAGVLFFRPLLSGAAYPYMDAMFALLLLLAAGLVCLRSDGTSVSLKPVRYIAALTAAFWLWCLLSILWSTDPGMGVRELVLLTAGLAVFYLASYFVSRQPEGLPAVHFLVLVISLIVSARAIYQKLWGLRALREALGRLALTGQEAGDLAAHIASGRVFAGFFNPNMLAGFCAVMVPLMLAFTVQDRRFSTRLITAAAAGMLIITIILSGSLGGSLAAAVGVTLFFMLSKEIRWRHAAIALGIAGVLIVPVFALRGADFLLGPDGSLTQRFGYMAAGTRMGMVHSITGWGAGSVPGALMGYVSLAIRPVNDPHNFLIRAWATWGGVGLVLLTGFLGSLIRWVSRGWRTGTGAPLLAGFIGSSAAFLFHSLMDMNFWVPETALFGWAAMGGALGFSIRVKGQNRAPDGINIKGRIAAGGFCFALCLPLLLIFQAEFFAYQGRQASLRREFPVAADYLQRARLLLPFAGRFTLDEGRSLARAGRLEEASVLLGKAQVQLPASPYPPWELGRIDLAAVKPGRALGHLDDALGKFPTSPRIRLDMAEALLRMGLTEKAKHILKEVKYYARFDPTAGRYAEELLAELMKAGGTEK